VNGFIILFTMLPHADAMLRIALFMVRSRMLAASSLDADRVANASGAMELYP
jgi:hypothetical protein